MPTYEHTYVVDRIRHALSGAFAACFGGAPTAAVDVREADRAEFGDYASNLAMIEAKGLGKPPRRVAEELAAAMRDCASPDELARIEVAGPGFLNVFVHPRFLQRVLARILADGGAYGRWALGAGARVQVEFVSSNPTGPLTVGHGRQAVLGDVLATLYDWLGHDVHREYYFNDEGRQIDLLAESLWVRHRKLEGETHPIPEDGYHGAYLRDVAEAVHAEPEGVVAAAEFRVFDDRARAWYAREAVSRMTRWIEEDLARLGVRFDTWFSEATLHRSGEVGAALAALRARGGTYEKDGATWLKAETHGGAKDAVLIRSDGRPTYLMVDIAYHIDKHRRGFDRVINVQGADHHAQQSCVQAAMRILGYPQGWLSYAVHQFVSLKEGGEMAKMSTRAGRFVTLRQLIDELGKDIVRYFMISRKPEAHLEFDLDLARAESLDNPATYVQYAHTRIRSIFRKAGSTIERWEDVDLAPLIEPEELALIRRLDRFPQVVRIAAQEFSPHLVAEYALDLSRALHAYYDKHRVLSEEEGLTRARLALLHALGTTLGNTLNALGMDAPSVM